MSQSYNPYFFDPEQKRFFMTDGGRLFQHQLMGSWGWIEWDKMDSQAGHLQRALAEAGQEEAAARMTVLMFRSFPYEEPISERGMEAVTRARQAIETQNPAGVGHLMGDLRFAATEECRARHSDPDRSIMRVHEVYSRVQEEQRDTLAHVINDPVIVLDRTAFEKLTRVDTPASDEPER